MHVNAVSNAIYIYIYIYIYILRLKLKIALNKNPVVFLFILASLVLVSKIGWGAVREAIQCRDTSLYFPMMSEADVLICVTKNYVIECV
jgi:hypothetical protein